MKINKAKLNALLRSGLRSEVKTRKQLAAQLGLDPTSLTRWFSNRDRLGNPRYPVVPDRHVLKILQIFDLDVVCLEFDDEAFQAHCFGIALERAEARGESPKSLSRMEKAAARKLTIPARRQRRRKPAMVMSGTLVVAVALTLGWLVEWQESGTSLPPVVVANTECWTGYSESLGSFDQIDEADPCHYGKLLHSALTLLKTRNGGGQQPQSDAMRDYMLFLSHNLDQRRQQQRMTLNFELGRSELARLDYAAALDYFQATIESLAATSALDPEVLAELSAYTALAVYGDKPWRYARQSYQRMLYEDPLWNRFWSGSGQPDRSGDELRELALSELDNGNLSLARWHIDEALRATGQHLGEAHFSMASNWLVLSRILALQADFAEARVYAQKALDLDRRLFGNRHPRVSQDRMVLTLLSLGEGDYAAAFDAYQPLSEYFADYVSTDHPAAAMNQWLGQGLARLSQAGMIDDTTAKSRLEQEAWNDLNQAFAADNPFIPRRFAALLRHEAMSLPATPQRLGHSGQD